MEYIRITEQNLEQEHICCAISSNKDPQVMAKKEWLAQRIPEGLTFLRADARGKCFIEYIPAEKAWVPISAPGYMYIGCFWVSGSLKGHGCGNDLLDECIRDSKAQGKAGLCAISSSKKKPFLSDPGYLAHRGFIHADSAAPYFELLYLPFDGNAPVPQFLPQVKEPRCDGQGFTVFYSGGCPYTAKYVPLMVNIAEEHRIPLKTVHFSSAEEVRSSPAVFSSFSLFYNGGFVTHEMLSEKKFAALCDSILAGKDTAK